MTAPRPAAGGGRRLGVAPERLPRWLEGLTERHGSPAVVEPAGSGPAPDLHIGCADGTTVALATPFAWSPGSDPLAGFVSAARAPRRAAVLLVRGGRWAVGVYDGSVLLASKVEARLVQGRTAAGGWSQQRYARRRGQQSAAVVTAARETAVRVLLPPAEGMTALFPGGNRELLAAVLADARLTELAPLRRDGWLDLGEPSRAALLAAPAQFRAVRITIVEPGDRSGC